MYEDLFQLEYMKQIEGTMDEIGIRLPTENLFHYTSSIGTIENILSTGDIWLSKSSTMNDRYEISYGIKLAQKAVEKYKSKSDDAEKLFFPVSDALLGSLYNYYILSFSKNENSRFLWESYSNKNGYNIEFNTKFISDFVHSEKQYKNVFENGTHRTEMDRIKIIIKENKNLTADIPSYGFERTAGYVIYNKEIQEGIINNLCDYMLENKNDRSAVFVAGNELINQLMLFKDPFFKDEQEYRLIVKIKGEKTKNRKYLRRVENYRERNNCLIPYIILNMKNPSEYIETVTIGYGNRELYCKSTLEDYVSTISPNIKVNMAVSPLQV